MKRIYSIILCLMLLFLAGSPISARAQGIASQGKSAVDTTFAHFYLMRSVNAVSSSIPYNQTSTVIDPAGGVHTAYFTNLGIQYVFCPANCSIPASWSQVSLFSDGFPESLAYPSLALDPSGRPRMMWYVEPDYYYAECNAGCLNAAQWQVLKVPIALDSLDYPKTARYFALDSQGRPRFVTYGADYDDYGSYEGLRYNTCDTSCTSPADWHTAVIDLDQWVSAPQIAMTSGGKPRVMGKIDDETLIYLGCDENCLQSSGWDGVTLYAIGSNDNFSFRLDLQDRPRVAYYREYLSYDDNLYYAWNNSPDYTSTAWDIYAQLLAPFDWRTVDLAIDSQGRPHLAFASSKGDLEYTQCTTNCESGAAAWQLQHVETSAELDAADPIYDAACSPPTWLVEGYSSLALDGADRPSISYYARNSKLCLGGDGKYHTLHDVTALRFATAGAGPTPGNIKTYLPLTIH